MILILNTILKILTVIGRKETVTIPKDYYES